MKKKLLETAVSFSRFTNVFAAKVSYFEFKTLNSQNEDGKRYFSFPIARGRDGI